MFGIILPINFYSPYKANSIIEFWRSWHITLSRFLRDYLYIPLGGNRKGAVRRYINLMITMLLGGLWHGASWTFIIWGGMHGLYLSINHAWNIIAEKIFTRNSGELLITKIFGRLITFSAIVFAWVMFRAESLSGAMAMYSGMLGHNGLALPAWAESRLSGLDEITKLFGINYNGMFHNEVFGSPKTGGMLLFIMFIVVWCTPNILYWMRSETPALNINDFIKRHPVKLSWKPTYAWAIIMVVIAYVSLKSMLVNVSEFLYFQF